MKVGGDMDTKLKTKRQECGTTQVEVAKIAGLSERSYKYIESGERIPRVDVAIKIAKSLGTTVEALFSDD